MVLGSHEGDRRTFSLWLKEWGSMGEGVPDRGKITIQRQAGIKAQKKQSKL